MWTQTDSTNAHCTYTETLTFSPELSGDYAWIKFDAATRTLTIGVPDPAITATKTATITVTSTLDNGSVDSLGNVATAASTQGGYTFKATLLQFDCDSMTLNLPTSLTNAAIEVDNFESETMTFTDAGNTVSNSDCGTVSYSIDPVLNWVTVS